MACCRVIWIISGATKNYTIILNVILPEPETEVCVRIDQYLYYWTVLQRGGHKRLCPALSTPIGYDMNICQTNRPVIPTISSWTSFEQRCHICPFPLYWHLTTSKRWVIYYRHCHTNSVATSFKYSGKILSSPGAFPLFNFKILVSTSVLVVSMSQYERYE